MKRLFFVLLSICLFTVVDAQNGGPLDKLTITGSFNIEKDSCYFKSEDIVCDKNGVYFYFDQLDTLKFKADVEASIERDSIKLSADKNIFVQIGGNDDDGSDLKTGEGKYLVDKNVGGTHQNSHVILCKDSLPVTLTFEKKEYVLDNIINLIKNTITRDTIAGCQKVPALELKYPLISKFLKEIKYSVNDSILDSIELSEELCNLDTIIIKYKATVGKEEVEGDYVVIVTNKKSDASTLWIIIVVIVLLIVVGFIVFKRPIGAVVSKLFEGKKKRKKTDSVPENDNSKSNVAQNIAGDNTLKKGDVNQAKNETNSDCKHVAQTEIKEKISNNDESYAKLNAELQKLYQQFNLDDNNLTTLISRIETIKSRLSNAIKCSDGRNFECVIYDVTKKLIENQSAQSVVIEEAPKQSQQETLQVDLLKVKEETRQKVYGEIIEKFEKIDQNNNQKIVSEAKNKARSNTNGDCVEAIIGTIKEKLENAKKIDATLINSHNNRTPVMQWVVNKLVSEGVASLEKFKDSESSPIIKELVRLLNSGIEAGNRLSDEAIIEDAIKGLKFSDEQQKYLLNKVIERINANVTDESKKMKSDISLEDFGRVIAEKIQVEIPSDVQNAEDNLFKRCLNEVGNVFGCELESFDKESLEKSLRIALGQRLKERYRNHIQSDDYEAISNELEKALEDSRWIEKMLKDNSAERKENLEKKICDKHDMDIVNGKQKDIAELFPNEHFDSIHKLINSLFKEVKNAKVKVSDAEESRNLIIDDLEEKISGLDNSYVSSEQKDVLALMGKYDQLIKDQKSGLNSTIKEKEEIIAERDNQITNLKAEVVESQKEITDLKETKDSLMGESMVLVEKLASLAANVKNSWRTLLNPCSNNEENQVVDIEDRMHLQLSEVVDRLNSFKVEGEVPPIGVRKAVQKKLIDELTAEHSVINTICRYYAYSRLPFMTDTSREYGVTLRRKNMSELYNAVEMLYVQFGISLYIPSLFVAGIEEGDYEDMTGKEYSDLDNLCPNSCNHFDKIDSNTKPAKMIVDIVNVGYSVDGELKRKSSVLTY